MRKKFLAYMQKKEMLKKGDGVVLGVSGGADSVCLLLLFCEVMEEMQLHLQVVHVEHGIRGEDSREDAAFVKELCRRKKVPFALYEFSVETYAREHQLGVEEAGRKLRYETFATEAAKLREREHCQVKIAVAHNANDNGETVLFHMARGTGLDGLCGIPPVRENIIRPLLGMTRREIETYLAEKQQDFRRDETNFLPQYDRNKLRQRAMPAMEEVNPKAVEHIQKTTEELREISGYLQEESRRILRQITVERNRETEAKESPAIYRQKLLQYPRVLRRRVIHLWISSYANGGKDITSTHVLEVEKLLDAGVGKIISLPYGLQARNGYEEILLEKRPRRNLFGEEGIDQAENGTRRAEESREEIFVGVQRFHLGETHCFCYGRNTLEMKVDSYEKSLVIPQKTYTKWFDYDKIKSNLEIRNRRTGDYLTIDSFGGRKKFKDYCIDVKIPKEQRDGITLLCEGNHILWAVGYRISEKYKVDATTRKILKVQIMEEEENE